jgi:hypothetical protein
VALSSTSVGTANVLALRHGLGSVVDRDIISVAVGQQLDAAGIGAGVRRRALGTADTLLVHLRIADAYFGHAGLLRSKARPRGGAGLWVEYAGAVRRHLRLVSREDAEPRLAELEDRLAHHHATLTALRPSALGERSAPYAALLRRLSDELGMVRAARVAESRSRGIDAVRQAQDGEEAQAELLRRYRHAAPEPVG